MITLVMAEFGRSVAEVLKTETVTSFKKYIGFDSLHLYTDDFNARSEDFDKDIKIIKCESLFKNHPREGWRNNDYYKILGLLNVESEISVSMDSDMRVLNGDAKTIIDMTLRFGLCIPLNPRYLIKVDGIIGADGGYSLDEDATRGNSLSFNMTPISFCKSSVGAKKVLATYCDEMKNNPARGPLVMWRAVWQTGFYPCILPPQWCVCPQHLNCKNEIMLHIGHELVKNNYK